MKKIFFIIMGLTLLLLAIYPPVLPGSMSSFKFPGPVPNRVLIGADHGKLHISKEFGRHKTITLEHEIFLGLWILEFLLVAHLCALVIAQKRSLWFRLLRISSVCLIVCAIFLMVLEEGKYHAAKKVRHEVNERWRGIATSERVRYADDCSRHNQRALLSLQSGYAERAEQEVRQALRGNIAILKRYSQRSCLSDGKKTNIGRRVVALESLLEEDAMKSEESVPNK